MIITPHGVYFAFNKKHGILSIHEVDYTTKIKDYRGGSDPLPGDIKFGGWYYARSMNDVSANDENGNPLIHGGDWGLYGIIDQMVFRVKDQQGLSVFLQESGGPTQVNVISHYTGFGVNYRGLLPHRPDDTFGVAYNIATLSGHYQEANGLINAERALEITYLIQVTPSITFQPDLQFITSPGGDPSIKNATVVLLRGAVSF